MDTLPVGQQAIHATEVASRGVLLLVVVGILSLVGFGIFLGLRSRADRPTTGRRFPPGSWIALVLAAVVAFLFVSYRIADLRSSATHRISHAAFQIHLNDDFARWTRDGAAAPEIVDPEWVNDAAGSTAWSASESGLSVNARQPGPQGRLVGYSGLEVSREEARAKARSSAVEQLAALLVWRVRGLEHEGTRLDPQEIRTLARRRVGDNWARLVEHRFEQEVPLRYGYHRSAVLVRADRSTLDRLEAVLQTDIRHGTLRMIQWERRIVSTVLPALGLVLVVLLLYFFLNAGTKGHFAWPLRVLSLGALSLLFLGLLYFKGWLKFGAMPF